MSFPVHAITLDLDDTLWPFAPIGARIEHALHAWMERHSPQTALRFPIAEMRRLRDRVFAEHPQHAHDLSLLRRLTIERALRDSGGDVALAEAAYAIFFGERNRVDFYPDAHAAWKMLASGLAAPCSRAPSWKRKCPAMPIAARSALPLLNAAIGTRADSRRNAARASG